MRIVADGLRFLDQVVRVHADAVADNEAGLEGEEVPLGTGGGELILGVDAQAVEFVFYRGYAYDYAMPAIRGIPGPYRLFFVSFDCHEPKHVHVQRERRVCKYWMEPVVLASNHGFSPVELNTVGQLLRDNRNQILEAWDEHCGTRR